MEAEESVIRKAYFRMAQQYHPDKNPKGREMFEKVSMKLKSHILRRPQSLKKISQYNLKLPNNVKKIVDFFKFLWPSLSINFS